MSFGIVSYAEAAEGMGVAPPDYFWISVRFVIALVVIGVGLYYGLKLLMSKFAFRYASGSNEGWMEVIDRVYLDARNYVALVRVGESYVVLGVSERGVNLLMELDERPVGNVLHQGGFKRYLERFLSKG